jgi:hypothetical protein
VFDLEGQDVLNALHVPLDLSLEVWNFSLFLHKFTWTLKGSFSNVHQPHDNVNISLFGSETGVDVEKRS